MSAWHVSGPMAERYASGSAAEPEAWSLEKHIESCGPCAVRVSTAVQRSPAGLVLAEIRATVLAGRTPAAAPVRWTARMMWAAGPALRGAWLLSLAAVIGGALFLAYGVGFEGARPLLLALSPAVPLAGVALSYGRYSDPMHEITAATPSGGLRLLLIRTAAVLAVSVPLLAAASALLPDPAGPPGAAAWLLPGLALTLAALALGSYTGCRIAATVLACAWVMAVLAPLAGPPALAAEAARLVSGPDAQAGWAAAAVVCAGLLAVRRSSFDHLESV
ncbi:zf-HC2 domain-containing protein [Streptomyces jumonjinensis]|uniref:zf-HC2 domain-containing protein n=1 Tax=Streptomyces jumonjinensis TaxID=1945 RepID=UPI0037A6D975